MKKLLNDPADVVAEALAGMAAAHPDRLRVDLEHRLVLRAGGPVRGKVAVVSGGGSGHEPLHAGYVGLGMLDAACCGEVFTSPVPGQVVAATRATDGGAGVLHVVKNYTGDLLNFEMAAEIVAAGVDGPPVELAHVVTDDDVAVEDSTWTIGRRGVGVTVLLEKIVGAAAEERWPLDRCHALAERVNRQGRSMAMALTSCTVPAAGRPTFELGEDEMELGVGIHGEAGRATVPVAPAREVAASLVSAVRSDLGLRRGESVLALVNGLGGTPLLELYVMAHEVHRLLAGAGVGVARSLVGNYVTSLEMAGCSVTLLRADEELLRLYDAPVNTPGLRWGV
ncbi:dihydroxyacetone kinase subunit DhaK [Ornithinimicrobium cerasi]|uniref:dihydroxyacetone kinase subunit DhaK n=1 Tax=Ornithinimicrobium cerasi TaxID=2248773 RepID=UPI000EFEAF17|nr:dihydroxyacetone kinase subunit DhaK [Ornithinimicrobium cerasi]